MLNLANYPGLEDALKCSHPIVQDIAFRFNRWGSLSEKQIALVLKLAADANKPAEPVVPGEWVGTVGERTRLSVRLEKQIQCETQWGTSYLHLFKDELGNDYKWFTSKRLRNQTGNPVEVGDWMFVKATIKGHEEYKGRKQTVLSRVIFAC